MTEQEGGALQPQHSNFLSRRHMLDCSFSGITLTKEPTREADARVSIYTKEFGRISAFVQGCQKSTSKLSAHLEPGRLIRGRLIEKTRLRIVDAITENAFRGIKGHGLGSERAIALLSSIHEQTGEFEPDERLWNFCNQSLMLLNDASVPENQLPADFKTIDLHIRMKTQEVFGC